jgi:hypothetical protein
LTPADRRAGRPQGRRALTIILAACLALGAALPYAGVSAAPAPELEPLSTQPEGVTVDTGRLSVPSDGSFRIGVEVEVPEPTSYLEVRLQIRRPSGRLLIQRTEVRSDVETGTVEVEFARELADLELRPDAYPYEIRVRSQFEEVVEKVASGFLLVHAPEPDVTPVALAVRISTAPRFNTQGHFVTDPARSTGALEQAEELARAVLDDPALRLTLALSPVTLDEWARIAQGYLVAESDEGLVEVGPGEPGPTRYAAALTSLQEAIATGRLELLEVGYADPDIAALDSVGRVGDLAAHYSRGLSAYLATLETSPTAGTAVAYDALPASALDVLAERGIRFVLLAPEKLAEEEASVAGGIYPLEESAVSACVLDRGTCDSIDQGDPSAGALVVFRHAISERWSEPVVTLTDLGPGRPGTVASVLELAGFVQDAVWAELATTSELSGGASGDPVSLPQSLESTPAAPSGYWEDAAQARMWAAGLEAAAGPGDPDARSASDASLIAQSARWAGPDGRWSMADRGRAFASYAERASRTVLERVTVAAQDVTLAGPRGDVPISIMNGSTKELTVWLSMRGDELDLTGPDEELVTLSPQENFHTVGVDLQSALSGTLVVEIRAEEVLLATGTSVVRASYLDRLAIVGGVAVLLLGLLLFIRKRVRAADADTMMPGEDVPASGEDAPR